LGIANPIYRQNLLFFTPLFRKNIWLNPITAAMGKEQTSDSYKNTLLIYFHQ